MKIGLRITTKEFNINKKEGFPSWKVGDKVFCDNALYNLVDNLNQYFK